MKAVVAAFNQEKALVGAFSVITNLRMELFQALVCWLLGSAAVITIYWLHFIIRSAVSQRSPFSIRPAAPLAAWWAAALFVIVCSSAYSCSYPAISSVSINPAHAAENGFLSSDAMTVHSETSASACTKMCHPPHSCEVVPPAPGWWRHQEERCSRLPLDSADTG